MPATFPGKQNVGGLLSNYKTTLCKNFQETGFCKYRQNCVYAHGEVELRRLDDPMPPVPPTVMLFNPSRKNQKNPQANAKHVPAPQSTFLQPVPILQQDPLEFYALYNYAYHYQMVPYPMPMPHYYNQYSMSDDTVRSGPAGTYPIKSKSSDASSS